MKSFRFALKELIYTWNSHVCTWTPRSTAFIYVTHTHTHTHTHRHTPQHCTYLCHTHTHTHTHTHIVQKFNTFCVVLADFTRVSPDTYRQAQRHHDKPTITHSH